jgi:hypothetical protein
MRSFVSNNINNALHLASICFAAVLATAGHATTWYVDSAATGSRNGTSWANAWTALSQISGVHAGDTVYISGGPSGSSQNYTTTAAWLPAGGSAGNPVTYKIGQDSAHNGTAQFVGGTTYHFISGAVQNVVLSGDAGDGQRHFLYQSGLRFADCGGSINFRISYVSVPAATFKFMYLNGGGHGIEIDHCYVHKVQGSSGDDDSILTMGPDQATAFDVNKIHDNVFDVPSSGNGTGDDCIQGAQWGCSVYNNVITGYIVPAYPRTQHQDGWQLLNGTYCKCYGNVFINICNYPVFGDAYDGDFVHFWVYNNNIIITDPGIRASNPPQGIAIGPDGGSFSHLGHWPAFTDVVVANNLIVDYGGHAAINLRNNPGQSSAFTSCVVSNNISINSGGVGLNSSGVVSQNNQMSLGMASGAGHFVSYTQNQGDVADFHLVSGDTFFVHKAVSLSQYFSSDKDGITRPQGQAWDIGPYELVSGSPPQHLNTH